MTMQFIASSVATGSVDMSFTNIPQTFTHLQLRVFARSSYAGSTDFLYMRFGSNGSSVDFGSNYNSHKLIGDGSATASGTTGQTTFIEMPIVTGATATSGLFGCAIIDILDYTNTNKNKVVRAVGGYDANGSGNIRLQSGVWFGTAALNVLVCSTGTNYAASGSRVDLYGITTSDLTGA